MSEDTRMWDSNPEVRAMARGYGAACKGFDPLAHEAWKRQEAAKQEASERFGQQLEESVKRLGEARDA